MKDICLKISFYERNDIEINLYYREMGVIYENFIKCNGTGR